MDLLLRGAEPELRGWCPHTNLKERMSTKSPGKDAKRWRALARELGGVIGRSTRPTCFLLGAGASLSSGGPTTAQVMDAIRDATGVRLAGIDPMRAIHLLPEQERQDTLAPLFSCVAPGPGYLALAALAKHRPILILNLNWDNALAQACRRVGVPSHSFDIKADSATWPSGFTDSSGAGLIDVHIHGMLGEECRFGTLETLTFTAQQEAYLVDNGLRYTTACIGAEIIRENDLPQLFKSRLLSEDPTRTSSQHWYFIRTKGDAEADDRLRQTLTFASALTYVSGPDIDFDELMTLITDRALAIAVSGAK